MLRAIHKASVCADTLPDELAAHAPSNPTSTSPSSGPAGHDHAQTAPSPRVPPRPDDWQDSEATSDPRAAPLPIPPPLEHSSKGFARLVWRYMHQDTLAQTATATSLSMKAVPFYTSAGLERVFQSEAHAVISDKAHRSGQSVSAASGAMEQRVSRLLSYTLTYLTHTGSVLAWRDGVYVICDYVIATQLSKMLRLLPHAPGVRVAKEPAMRAEALCIRLRRADSRFQYVPLASVVEGLELLAQRGLVQPVLGHSYLPMVPLQASQERLAKVASR